MYLVAPPRKKTILFEKQKISLYIKFHEISTHYWHRIIKYKDQQKDNLT